MKALLSVYNKDNIEHIGTSLSEAGYEIISTGGTQKLLTEAQNRRILNRRRAEVLDALKLGKNVDRSLFTGREPKEGTKSSILNAFGIGTVKTGKPKLREGLSSADYAEFMGKAFEANPRILTWRNKLFQ